MMTHILPNHLSTLMDVSWMYGLCWTTTGNTCTFNDHFSSRTLGWYLEQSFRRNLLTFPNSNFTYIPKFKFWFKNSRRKLVDKCRVLPVTWLLLDPRLRNTNWQMKPCLESFRSTFHGNGLFSMAAGQLPCPIWAGTGCYRHIKIQETGNVSMTCPFCHPGLLCSEGGRDGRSWHVKDMIMCLLGLRPCRYCPQEQPCSTLEAYKF